MNKTMNLLGIIGIIVMQGSALPAIFGLIHGYKELPINMIWMIWFGLLLFTTKAVYDNLHFYIAANFIGFFLQSTILVLYYVT